MFIKSLSRLALACVALSSISALAQTLPVQDDNSLKVTLPDLKTKLELNAAVLWLKPGASNLKQRITSSITHLDRARNQS